jgi:hypothetical protein
MHRLFDCAGRGALTSRDCTGIDHAHGCGSDFYRSEHRHSNCPRARCLSVGLVKSTCCATPAQTALGEVRDRGLDCRIFGRLPSISSVQIDGAKIMVPMISFAFSPSPNKGHAPRPAAALLAGDRRLQARRAALAPQPACQGGTRYCAVWLQIFFEDALRLAHGLSTVRVQAFGSFMR